ncbi:MAG: class I SAM-dependent methyltransferase [Candidatus Omnitrophota bacterium]
MDKKFECYRDWEYKRLGDYHRNLDPNWSYTPTYLVKMKYIRNYLHSLPKNLRILDAGCGEGVLVEEFLTKGYQITGIDLNYESEYVQRADILHLPYPDNTFDVILMLDMIEHISFEDQPRALSEAKRVLRPDGALVMSVPNLVHLNSRVRNLLTGKFDRTDKEENHPGERPYKENIMLLTNAGFDIKKIKGITLTMPFIYRGIICRRPARFRWLHDILNIFAIPQLAMINIFVCKSISGY